MMHQVKVEHICMVYNAVIGVDHFTYRRKSVNKFIIHECTAVDKMHLHIRYILYPAAQQP